jgi:hypothetical protein
MLYLDSAKELSMNDEELREVTRKTADMLFGPPKKGEGAYQLWRQFDPELARHMSMFYTGRPHSNGFSGSPRGLGGGEQLAA